VGHEEPESHRHTNGVGQVNGQRVPADKFYEGGKRRNMADDDRTDDARWGFERLLCKANQEI